MRSPSFAGLILAAGASSRMGQDKALLPWQGDTLLGAAIEALRLHTELVITVAGVNAAAVRPIVWSKGAFLVENPEPERGQFSSLQAGLQAVLDHGRDAAIIALVDRPPAHHETLRRLKSEFLKAAAEGNWALVPEVNGVHGHPILVGREMIEVFLRAPVTATAKLVRETNAERVAYLPVADPVITMNINTREDYQRIAGATISTHV